MNPANKDAIPVAFLSSLSDGLENLREQLFADSKGQLWVAEQNRSDLDPGKKHPLEIVDACVDALKQTEIFICVLGGSEQAMLAGGTPIELGGIESLVSYFEIEIFQASLIQIPIVFFERAGFTPGRSMAEFLKVLNRSAVVTRWIKGLPNSETTQIRNAVKATIQNRGNLQKRAARQLRRAASDLATRLIATRGRLRDVLAGGSDMLWMQGDRISPKPRKSGDEATLNRAQNLLRIAAEEKRHDHRLSRLYLVFRELMASFYLDSFDPKPLGLWNSAFGLWCGSAAWYGLHNHLALGVIGGLWSQHLVRARLQKDRPSDIINADLRPPLGGLASAYLSLAKLCGNPWLRWQVCRAGIKLANAVIEAGAGDDLGIFAVRGSLFFAELRPFSGMSDFKKLLLLAEKQPERLELNAEAHTYLGRGYTLLRQCDKAGEHLREAVKLWEHIVQEKQSEEEFLVKAMKHLLDYQIKTRQFEEATATASRALHLAQSKGISDQARQIENILANTALKLHRDKAAK
jgi:hypothetical protein